MKKSFLKWSTCIAGMLLAFSLTSCVSERDETPEVPTGDGTLVINITPTQVGGTRTVTELTTDQSADELMVQNMVIGVFKADVGNDGAVVTIQDYTVNASASTGISRLANIENSTSHFAVGDEVLVVMNVPASIVTKLKNTTNITTRKKFIGVFDGTANNGINIDQALTQKDDYSDPTANTVNAAYLPMFGEGTITQAKQSDNTTDMSNSYKADIQVIHMVSKITLNSVTFNTTGNASAQPTDKLELKEMFLINVPTALDFEFSTNTTVAGTAFTATYQFARQNTNLYQGWTSDYTKDAANLDTNSDNTLDADKDYRDYLGTGAVTDEVSGGVLTGNSMNHSYTLYTMPNNNTTAATKLIIKAALNGTDYYYPIDLYNNDNYTMSSDTKVYPNRNYVVDVIIKGVGATTPYAELGNQQTTTAGVSVQAWTSASNTTTFGHDGGAPTVN